MARLAAKKEIAESALKVLFNLSFERELACFRRSNRGDGMSRKTKTGREWHRGVRAREGL